MALTKDRLVTRLQTQIGMSFSQSLTTHDYSHFTSPRAYRPETQVITRS